MKAVRYHSYGDSEVLVHEDADRPVAGPGQVVVRVAGTGFNLLDVLIRAGVLRDAVPVTFPHVPGCDVSGVITEVGAGVTDWREGDAVVAFLPANAPGAAAEFVAAPVEVLARAPRSVDLADAAALPLAGLTAWQALVEHARLEAGQTVLVNGAGGGVGGFAVQLAVRAGATVTATASARSHDRVRAQGATRIVDSTATPVVDALAGQRFDVVLQLVNTTPEDTARLVDLVADGGVLVSATSPGPQDAGRGVRTEQVYVRSDAAQLAELVARVDAGDLALDVTRRPLVDLPAVHDEAVTGRVSGKVVLIP
ncbi:MAG: NADP-dependent oxidoreductase [Saccharothrix sp.]|nr:NADP-dependent oxidoreductase [Saccharothrix sp.]